MTDSLLPHAPALDEPLEMLEACHERIEAQLKTLERLAAYLPDHGADEQSRQAARAILRYFEMAGPNHHEDEEQNLFPMLVSRAGTDDRTAVGALVSNLLADHVKMASAVGAVREQLIPIADGTAAMLDPASVCLMTTVYRRHIEKENRELLSLSRKLLTPQDVEDLSRAMTARRSRKD